MAKRIWKTMAFLLVLDVIAMFYLLHIGSSIWLVNATAAPFACRDLVVRS